MAFLSRVYRSPMSGNDTQLSRKEYSPKNESTDHPGYVFLPAGRHFLLLDRSCERGDGIEVPPERALSFLDCSTSGVASCDGRTLVWPLKGWGGLTICFMPGSMT